ncbi:PREDICTED: nose resistant to fluoxetine protein 6-like [Nicrophorus vespilloides]|uniref:Nose resistant to fluoxetine protein 6-like n=1 Tax=Nicrophorus vespilloides TaxID=110193 RepID=A0ABM1MBJ2_NICVS|nr:PREDICTED: nose resistant to fluoxetine protein 6-like [Nicrophorus vespilloides]
MLYLYCILALVLVVGIGTTFEAWARYKTPEEYEKITTSTTMRKLCTAFSLLKNWDRLGSEISTEDGKALAPIQGIRVLNMFFVVTSHTCMLELHGPIANPRFAEDSTLRTLNMFVSNGNMVMQTSFMISAWMLSYGICVAFENRKFNFKAMIQIIVHRFIRLYPLLIIMLGFGATWLRHSGRGPIFNEIVDYEYRNCRNNWLLNLLFINNLYKSEQMCMQQTWYLAVDTQTFILGLFIMMAVIKNPQHAKNIFGSIIFLSICITFIQHYYNAYDILFRSYPEILYSMYMKLPQWHTMFIGTQHHIPCYVQGLACGYYFHKIRKEKKTIVLKKGVYFLLLCYMWIGPIFTILIAAAFYQDGFEASRWFAAFYHAIAKYSFGLPISIAIFTFTFGIGGPMINVINWKPFHVLGRLSFGVYLSHVHILRMNRAINKTLSFITERLLIRWMLGDVMLCYIVATVICLFVEMPTSALGPVDAVYQSCLKPD